MTDKPVTTAEPERSFWTCHVFDNEHNLLREHYVEGTRDEAADYCDRMSDSQETYLL